MHYYNLRSVKIFFVYKTNARKKNKQKTNCDGIARTVSTKAF